MKRTVFVILLMGMWLPGDASAQVAISPASAGSSLMAGGQPVSNLQPSTDRSFSWPIASDTRTLPVLSAQLAFAEFQRRSEKQSAESASYSATSVIQANLPDRLEYGEYEVQKTFTAPHTLLFKPIRFVGDQFVKVNIIARLLQSEVDHVERNDVAQTAISSANYKVSYKGETDVAGRAVHTFQVKPHKKRPGLFKGWIYLDVHTGSLLRAEGRVVKSPSLFVKNIEFVQDYMDIGSLTLPVHIHTEAYAFLVGRMIIDITHADYQPIPLEIESSLIQSPESSR